MDTDIVRHSDRVRWLTDAWEELSLKMYKQSVETYKPGNALYHTFALEIKI
jgi:hypothetical protein